MSDGTPVARTLNELERLILAPGLTQVQIAERLLGMPDDVAGLRRRSVTTSADSATAVYLAGEERPQPDYGMVVVLVVAPQVDANAAVAAIQRARWGDPEDHHVTASSPGADGIPAYREFWRAFPPGLFAIPNQPVYFLISYRAGDGYAYMFIGGTPVIRNALTLALVETLTAR